METRAVSPGSLVRAALLALIRLYQLTLSPWLGNPCRYEPTCSRYAAEAIEPVAGKDATRFAHSMTVLQDTLGEHHDTVVARQKVIDLSNSPPADDPARPEFERLLGRLADTGREAEESYGHALSRAARPKRLRWLG